MDHLRTDPSYVKIERQVQSGGETGAERVAVLRLFTPQGFQIMGVTLTLRYGKYVTLRSRGRDYYAAYYGAEIITPLLESWRRPRSRALSARPRGMHARLPPSCRGPVPWPQSAVVPLVVACSDGGLACEVHTATACMASDMRPPRCHPSTTARKRGTNPSDKHLATWRIAAICSLAVVTKAPSCAPADGSLASVSGAC